MFFDVLNFRVFLRYQALVLGMFLDRFATHLRAEMCAYLIICDICIDIFIKYLRIRYVRYLGCPDARERARPVFPPPPQAQRARARRDKYLGARNRKA